MNLIEYYTSVLAAAGHRVDKEGYVISLLHSPERPATVGGKALVLPTHERLSALNNTEVVFFHPLRENVMEGPSKVVEYFRNAALLEIEGALTALLKGLADLAASTAAHKNLTPTQSEFLSHVKKADQKTLDTLQAICENVSAANAKTPFFHMYLKKGAKLHGRSYKQGAIVTWPLYEELCKPENEKEKSVIGVSVRTGDFQRLKSLIEYVFPSLDEPNAYSFGSNSDQAPKFHALLGGFGSVAQRINEVLELMNPAFPAPIQPVSYTHLTLPTILLV